MAAGLHIALLDLATLRQQVRGREHWVFVFGPHHHGWIDKIDKLVGFYPTFPTVVGNVYPITLVPKTALPLAKLIKFLKRHQFQSPITEEDDIFIITDDEQEWIAMGNWMVGQFAEALPS